MSIVGTDPLTGRLLSDRCWNSSHDYCDEEDCKCLCHYAAEEDGDDDEDKG